MRFVFIILSLFLSHFVQANDGAYKASGNQLIPIFHNNIEVQKEVLTIEKKEDVFYVSVDYTFYNYDDEEVVIVGFEASPPMGDVDYTIQPSGNPYIFDFKVVMNDKELPAFVTIVTDSVYAEQGVINGMSDLKEIQTYAASDDYDFTSYFYVYHFKALFKKGVNKIKHTYRVEQSTSVMMNWQFDYILSAAKRWRGGKIGDFTLRMNLGAMEQFNIHQHFFQRVKDWNVNGRGFILDNLSSFDNGDANETLDCNIYEGWLTYRKKDFVPMGELSMYSLRFFAYHNFDAVNILPINIPMNHFEYFEWEQPNYLAKKIVRNYPFALKGFVFKNSALNDYFESTSWYEADPSYSGERATLNEEEKKWIDHFDAMK